MLLRGLLLTIVLLSTQAFGQQELSGIYGPFDEGKNYTGFDIQYISGFSVEQCQISCYNEPKCNAFSYDSCVTGCWLKAINTVNSTQSACQRSRFITAPRSCLIATPDGKAIFDLTAPKGGFRAPNKDYIYWFDYCGSPPDCVYGSDETTTTTGLCQIGVVNPEYNGYRIETSSDTRTGKVDLICREGPAELVFISESPILTYNFKMYAPCTMNNISSAEPVAKLGGVVVMTGQLIPNKSVEVRIGDRFFSDAAIATQGDIGSGTNVTLWECINLCEASTGCKSISWKGYTCWLNQIGTASPNNSIGTTYVLVSGQPCGGVEIRGDKIICSAAAGSGMQDVAVWNGQLKSYKKMIIYMNPLSYTLVKSNDTIILQCGNKYLSTQQTVSWIDDRDRASRYNSMAADEDYMYLKYTSGGVEKYLTIDGTTLIQSTVPSEAAKFMIKNGIGSQNTTLMQTNGNYLACTESTLFTQSSPGNIRIIKVIDSTSREQQNTPLYGVSQVSCLKSQYGLQNCRESLGTIHRPLQPGLYYNNADSLGNMLSNSVTYRLPGYYHFAHGVSGLTGEELPATLFDLHFCDGQTETIQDMYRGNFYQVPTELDAVPAPSCQFESVTKRYSSSNSIARSEDTKSAFSTTIKAEGGFLGVNVNAEASLHGSEEVKTASEKKSENSGQLAITETSCITSRVRRNDNVSFSNEFINDLAICINSNNASVWEDLIGKYGTHYYKEASLGGRLKMVSSVSREYYFSQSSLETNKELGGSFSAGASGAGWSAEASASYNEYQYDSYDEQSEFEGQTSKTSIISIGGAPGSYGPMGDSGSGANSYGDWAATTDLLPMPIEYSVGLIGTLLPILAGGVAVRRQWFDALASVIARGSTGADNSTEYMITIQMYSAWEIPNGDVNEPNPSFGPFAFKMRGDQEMPYWMPLGDQSIESSMIYQWGSTTSFSVRTLSIGEIRHLDISDLRRIAGATNGDDPSGWPVKSIQVIDVSTAREYNFGGATPLDLWRCQGSTCGGAAKCASGYPSSCTLFSDYPNNRIKTVITWSNPPLLGSSSDIKITYTGSKGSTYHIVQNNLCRDYVCGGKDSNGRTTHILNENPLGLLNGIKLELFSRLPTSIGSGSCTGRAMISFQNSMCQDSIWRYGLIQQLPSDTFLGLDQTDVQFRDCSSGNKIIIAYNGKDVPTRFTSSGICKDGGKLNVEVALYTPLASTGSIKLTNNNQSQSIIVTVMQAYPGAIMQQISTGWSTDGINITLTPTNLTIPIQPTTSISSIQTTTYDVNGTATVFISTKNIFLSQEATIPKMTTACATFIPNRIRSGPLVISNLCNGTTSTDNNGCMNTLDSYNLVDPLHQFYVASGFVTKDEDIPTLSSQDKLNIAASCSSVPSNTQRVTPVPIRSSRDLRGSILHGWPWDIFHSCAYHFWPFITVAGLNVKATAFPDVFVHLTMHLIIHSAACQLGISDATRLASSLVLAGCLWNAYLAYYSRVVW
ncbi:perforin-1-like [Planoprotostelium fungivorum]|uniref:Perforin-1-like n=1 Tax=Planoprotostelium fungivorum TaxID=1890364 RepID=A0A2P6N8A1_9EUKA|nr:perforin-1-like [Planoprotostelium fungivorum]